MLKQNFKELTNTFNSTLEQLKQRYPTLETVPGLKHVTDKIQYIMSKLKFWLDEGCFIGNKDVEIFIDSLSDRIEEYQKMLLEIDDEFTIKEE